LKCVELTLMRGDFTGYIQIQEGFLVLRNYTIRRCVRGKKGNFFNGSGTIFSIEASYV